MEHSWSPHGGGDIKSVPWMTKRYMFIFSYLCVHMRHFILTGTVLTLTFIRTLQGECYPPFTKEDTEAQSGAVMYPASHRKSQLGKLRTSKGSPAC